MAEAKRCPVWLGRGSRRTGSRVNAANPKTAGFCGDFQHVTGSVGRLVDRPL